MSDGASDSQSSTQVAPNQQPVPSVGNKKPTAAALDELVTIEIGKGDAKQTFKVYKGLLSFYSDYFRSVFNGDLAEATDKVVRLDDVEAETFEIFQSWLLIGELSSKDGIVGTCLSYVKIISIWVFGDRCLVLLLKNEAMDILIKKSGEENLIFGYPRHVYENTAPKSPLRRIIIDMMVYGNARFAVEGFDNALDWNEESKNDYVIALFDRPRDYKQWLAPFPDIDHCQYHDHSSDGEKHETCRNFRNKRDQLAEEERLEKKILDIGNRLQKAFLLPDKTSKEVGVEEMAKVFNELEFVDSKLQVAQRQAMQSTEIGEVLRTIVGLASIPSDGVFRFKKRANNLLAKWNNKRKSSDISS